MSNIKTICCVMGTRPEALKMAPLVRALKAYSQFKVLVLVTAQHREMMDQVLELFNIHVDHDLDIMRPNQKLGELTSRLMQKISDYFEEAKPDMVIAQGDTTTTFVASLVSFYQKIPFAFVEAGLRSGNFYSPFPEEMNRQFTSKIAALNFAPTEISKQNLLDDNIAPESITVTGNTVIDTLFEFAEQAKTDVTRDAAKKTILVTCHRRENFGQNILNICSALKDIALSRPDIEIVYPVHPNPNVKTPVYDNLSGIDNIKLIAPVNYTELVALMLQAYIVVTDSGGLQEEAPALNKPVLVLRTETERPEGVIAGAAKMVGVETQSIIDGVNVLLDNAEAYRAMANAPSPYGDGQASKRIANLVAEYFSKQAAGSEETLYDAQEITA